MLQLSFSLIQPFSPNYWTLTVIRFILGTSSAGIMVITFVYIVEITGPSKRELVTSFYHIPLALGEMIMPLFAYYLRSWALFSVGVGVPNLLFLMYFWVVPESAKWLISVGKLAEASKVIKKVAAL
jgi:MFS family permease